MMPPYNNCLHEPNIVPHEILNDAHSLRNKNPDIYLYIYISKSI